MAEKASSPHTQVTAPDFSAGEMCSEFRALAVNLLPLWHIVITWGSPSLGICSAQMCSGVGCYSYKVNRGGGVTNAGSFVLLCGWIQI
jgi:hypothetical protein